jgi:hypothetical protein
LENIIRAVESGELALMAQDFEAGVVDLGGFVELSDIFDLNFRIVLKLQIVNSLRVGVKALRWREKAPIRLLRIVEGELLQIFDVGLHGRHFRRLTRKQQQRAVRAMARLVEETVSGLLKVAATLGLNWRELVTRLFPAHDDDGGLRLKSNVFSVPSDHSGCG